jgi:hypothetical protein
LSEGGAGDAVIEASDYAGAKLILQTRGLSNKQWAFDQDGALTFPDNTVQTTAYTGGGADTGDITFENNTIIAAADTNFYIESKDDTDVVRAYIRLDPGNGLAEMRALSSYRSALFSSGGWTTAEWTGTGGTGQLAFTGATELQDFLDNSLGGSVNITFSINNGEFIAYDGRDGSGGDVNFSTSISPPADPTTVTDIEFRYYRESRIQIDSDDDEITIYGDGLDINLNSTASIDISAPQVTVIGSQYAQLQSGNNYMSVEGTEGAFISISTGEGNNTFAFEHVSGTTRLKLPAGGDIVDSNGDSVLGGGTAPTATSTSTAESIGYLGMPQNSKSADYELVIGDMGKHVYVTATSTITVPAYTSVDFPIGTTIAIVAGTGATVSIAITTDTMYLAGAGTTGTRTLAAFGMATLVKVAQSTWFISGVGLT